MPEFSIQTCPEVFVSETSTSRAIHRAVRRGELRKIGTKLYTRNLTEAPESLVKRNWYHLIGGYYPDALIADRTALENKPAEDGSVFLISKSQKVISIPGITFRPRTGPDPIETDKTFIGGARLASTPRAYLENMRTSRTRSGQVARTLSRSEIEARLDDLTRRQGDAALNKLRDDARPIAVELGLESEFEELSELIGTFLGTREAKIESTVGKARAAGQPFDPQRMDLFEKLFIALRETVPTPRPATADTGQALANLAFFEAYFSNFIEGTEFTVGEAREIVFEGAIPNERPEDAHDVLGTFRIVADSREMANCPANQAELDTLLRHRHGTIMQARPDKQPGAYKTAANQAGATIFVSPDLVTGTLEQGFEFYQALEEPFQRAVFMMILISEVHPFADGNGRTARIMMNAELVAGGEERIIIPTAYRTDYLGALKAFSANGLTEPLIRMLDRAQEFTGQIDWHDFEQVRAMLEASNAFAEGEEAKLRFPR